MSRYGRRRELYVPGKERLEVSQENVTLRLLALGAALLAAALSFGYAINNMLQAPTGWQTVEAGNSKTGITQQFTLTYNIGADGQNATKERKAVSAIFTQSLDHAYRVLSNRGDSQYTGLAALNASPNQEITVDPLLYAAFRTVEETGSRQPYFAPLFEHYNSLFTADSDEAAAEWDPELTESVGEYVRELAAYANDPAMVQVTLLPENRVRLDVSEEYLAYAKENELTSFVDFGCLLNAFLCDAAADALAENGYTGGILSSFDGYARALCGDALTVSLYDLADGKTVRVGEGDYHGPAALVVCRSFPLNSQDRSNYHCYADGTIRAPYIGRDGLLRAAASSLTALDRQGSAATLALKATEAFAAETLEEDLLEGISYIVTDHGEIRTTGSDFFLR